MGHGFVQLLPNVDTSDLPKPSVSGVTPSENAVPIHDPNSLHQKLIHLGLSATVGPLRIAHAHYNAFNLPGGVGVNTPIQIARNDGTYAKFVRLTNPTLGGANTFFTGSSGAMSNESAASANLGVIPFLDLILMPGEQLWAQNQGVAAYRITVANIDIPFRADVW